MTTQPNDFDPDDDGTDDGTQPAELATQPTARSLRVAADRAAKDRAEFEQTKKELAVYKAGLGTLKPKQVTAVLAAHEGELTPELLKATALELGFIEADEDEGEQRQIESEVREHEKISAAATGAGKASPTAVLRPEDVNAWPIDKQMRLLETQPDVYERLTRGETVAGVSFN